MMMMLDQLIDDIAKEKNLPRDEVIQVIETAVHKAALKQLGGNLDIEARYSEEEQEIELYQYKYVVDQVEEGEEDTQMTLDYARNLDPECEVGDSLGIVITAFKQKYKRVVKKVEPGREDFEISLKDAKKLKAKVKVDDSILVNPGLQKLGRVAAQKAKSVIIQELRNVERDMIFHEFRERKGDLIAGIVRRFERNNIIVDLGRTEALLPRSEQVPGEIHRPGDHIQAYLLDINRASRKPQIILSRSHPGLVMKLFELEVPEIHEGIVRIENCVREPGVRAKISVSSSEPDVDPVGACVGLKGSRVQRVVQELRGEAIDIVPYHPDPARYIVYAIAPAKVSRVYIDEHLHCMELIVPDDQLSKAIGRRGQNVRLAAQLTGWRIDIYSESRHEQLSQQAYEELARLEILDEARVDHLIQNGFRSVQELVDADPADLGGLLQLMEEEVAYLQERAEALLDVLIAEEAERRRLEAEALPPEGGFDGELPPEGGYDGELPPEAG